MSEDYLYKHVVIEANGMTVPQAREYVSPLREYVPLGPMVELSKDINTSTKDLVSVSRDTVTSVTKNTEITSNGQKTVHDETWEVITGIPKTKKSIDSGDSSPGYRVRPYKSDKNEIGLEDSAFADSGNETLNSGSGGKTNNITGGGTYKTVIQTSSENRPLSPSNSTYLSSSRLNRDSLYETYEHTRITRNRTPSPNSKLIGFGSNTIFGEDRPINEATSQQRRSSSYQETSLVRQAPFTDTLLQEQSNLNQGSRTLPSRTTPPAASTNATWNSTTSTQKKSKDTECLVPLKTRLVGEIRKRGKSSPPGVQAQPQIQTIHGEVNGTTWLFKSSTILVNETIRNPYQSLVPNYRSNIHPLTLHGITGNFIVQLNTDIKNQNIVHLEAQDGHLKHLGVPLSRTFDPKQPLDLSLRFFDNQVFVYYFEEEVARLPIQTKYTYPHAILNVANFDTLVLVTREGTTLKQLLPQPYINKFNLGAGDVLYFETVAYTDFNLNFLNDDGGKLDRLKIKPESGKVKHTLKKNTLLTYSYRGDNNHNVIKITAKEFGNLYHLAINDVFIGNFIGSPIEKVKGIYLETPKYLLAFEHRPAYK